MKKLIVLAVGILFSAGIVCAQDAATKKAEPAKTTDKKEMPQSGKCDMKNCCMMKGGKMMCMKDGKEMAMSADMTMKNGTKVMANGACMMKDGKKMMMKDGDCIDMDGNVHMEMKKDAPMKKEEPKKADDKK